MRSIKLVLTLIVVMLVSATSAFAAPGATLSTDSARRFVNLSFTGLKDVSKVSYLLYYDTNRGQKGFEGGFKNLSKMLRSSRRQILGTCSSGKCVYHANVKNVKLEATFYLKKGGTSKITKSLP